MPAPKRGDREPIRWRLLAIRESTELRQVDFVARLNEAARELYGTKAPRYSQSGLSKLENGPGAVTLEDVAVYALVDPLRRGRSWLGWGVVEGTEAIDPARARELTLDEIARAKRVAAVTELRDAAELALYRLTIDNGATATRRPESISEADRDASWALANTDVVRRLSAALPKVHVPTAD